MIRGITPIDTALEIMGLTQSQALMRFLFMETAMGQLAFAVGFMFSFFNSLERGNFRPVIMFVLMFFSLWILLVLPSYDRSAVVSAMERSGYTATQAEAVLRKSGYDAARVNPVVDAICQWMGSFTIMVAASFDRMGGLTAYLENPFYLTKLSIVAARTLERGIKDPRLGTRAIIFYQDNYLPALRQAGQDTRFSEKDLWPGHENIVSFYTRQARSEWEGLKEDLYKDVNGAEHIFDKVFERLYRKEPDRDRVVRLLLDSELSRKKTLYSRRTFISMRELSRGPQAAAPAGFTDWLVKDMPRAALRAMPYIQGGALFILLALLPVTLLAVYVWRRISILGVYLALLFSVKAWTVGWAAFDKIAGVMFIVGQGSAGSSLGAEPWQNAAVGAGVLFVPVIVTWGVLYAVKKINTV
jgi:hypothetical protein